MKEHDLDLFDKDKKKIGSLVLTTQLEYAKAAMPPNPNMNKKCSLKVRIHEATFKHD